MHPCLRLTHVHPRQHAHELVAAVTDDDVEVADLIEHFCCNIAKQLIPRGMALRSPLLPYLGYDPSLVQAGVPWPVEFTAAYGQVPIGAVTSMQRSEFGR